MGKRIFLGAAVGATLICGLAVSCLFFRAAWGQIPEPAEPPDQAVSVPAETSPPPSETEPEADWRLILVNPWNSLPRDFQVELTALGDGFYIDERVYPALTEMLEAARAEGLSPVVRSAYRTYEAQQTLYDNKVERLIAQGYSPEDAPREAAKWVAYPGTSEHEAGLALDIVAESWRDLVEDQENTPEQQWLMANAHHFGFILRYPREKQDVTGIGYEPWHYRYVGEEAASRIHAANLCLEEYLEQIG